MNMLRDRWYVLNFIARGVLFYCCSPCVAVNNMRPLYVIGTSAGMGMAFLSFAATLPLPMRFIPLSNRAAFVGFLVGGSIGTYSLYRLRLLRGSTPPRKPSFASPPSGDPVIPSSWAGLKVCVCQGSFQVRGKGQGSSVRISQKSINGKHFLNGIEAFCTHCK